MKHSRVFLFFLVSLYGFCDGHGLGQEVVVHLADKVVKTSAIKNVCQRWLDENQYVMSIDDKNGKPLKQKIVSVGTSQTPWYCVFRFNDEPYNDVVCTPDQEFYLFQSHQRVFAHQLKIGDVLCAKDKKFARISYVHHVKQNLPVYLIEVKGSHTFFVGRNGILTHNFALPAMYIGLSAAWGAGATTGGCAGSFLGPVTIVGGIVVGGFVGLLVHAVVSEHNRIGRYQLETTTPFYAVHRSGHDFEEDDPFNDNGDRPVIILEASGGAPTPPNPWDDKDKWQVPHKTPPEDVDAKIDPEKFRKAVEHATTVNNLNHYFGKQKHGFDKILHKMGCPKDIDIQKKLVEEILYEVHKCKDLPIEGTYKDMYIIVYDVTVCVRTYVGDGIIKISTMFCRSQNVL